MATERKQDLPLVSQRHTDQLASKQKIVRCLAPLRPDPIIITKHLHLIHFLQKFRTIKPQLTLSYEIKTRDHHFSNIHRKKSLCWSCSRMRMTPPKALLIRRAPASKRSRSQSRVFPLSYQKNSTHKTTNNESEEPTVGQQTTQIHTNTAKVGKLNNNETEKERETRSAINSRPNLRNKWDHYTEWWSALGDTTTIQQAAINSPSRVRVDRIFFAWGRAEMRRT